MRDRATPLHARVRLAALIVSGTSILAAPASGRAEDAFTEHLAPLFAERCTKCHGGERPKGRVDLEALRTRDDLLARPEIIEELIEAIEGGEMPPEDEPPIAEETRTRLLAALGAELRASVASAPPVALPLRRLNRFQYSSCVGDIFRLEGDVFRLPEKLVTRHDRYLDRSEMPERVEVSCRSLVPGGGLEGVVPFPQDLRAAHGFDNQANQLTLSPLLLDAFLALSTSIVESPGFDATTVGVWNELFAPPGEHVDVEPEISLRVHRLLRRAFRRRIDEETVARYAAYARAKITQGLTFTDAMKKIASAVLCSPLFLYRHETPAEEDDAFELASRLSFFLWSSGPDDELLRLADSGELREPSTLAATIDRMLADPKIERFLDTFPPQWMQIENVLAAIPDPEENPLFHLETTRPASVQMVLEPLLLFDAVFVENRPIGELLSPSFAYRSDFLRDWYESDLAPAEVDRERIAAENRERRERIEALELELAHIREATAAHEAQFPARLATALESFDAPASQAAWEEDQARLLSESVTLSDWHRIGPFVATTFEEAHDRSMIDESSVDLQKRHGDLAWTAAPEFVDGRVHELQGASCATYLHRTIDSPSARTVKVSLGSDDSFKLWLNGELVGEERVTRGVAPDQNSLGLELAAGRNTLLLKVVNGASGYGFYFRAETIDLPEDVASALREAPAERDAAASDAIRAHWLRVAPELAPLHRDHEDARTRLAEQLRAAQESLDRAPRPRPIEEHERDAKQRFEDDLRAKLRSRAFTRVPTVDPRYGGIVTNAAMLSMTSGPDRTHPIARGAWIVEVVLNDPPPPPPNDVPPLPDDESTESLTIRETFAKHRENPDCAGCHAKIDPLGFALENYDVTGRWRDRYPNGRDIDASGTLVGGREFSGAVEFKAALASESRRFARAFIAHLLRFALSRELAPGDSLTVDAIAEKAAKDDFRLRSIIREVALSDAFRRGR